MKKLNRSGRKALPPEKRKQPLVIFIDNGVVERLGGKEFTRKLATDYINLLSLETA